MKPIPFWRRYARLLRPDVPADVDDELRFHLAAKIDQLVAQGMRPDAARREAERRANAPGNAKITGIPAPKICAMLFALCGATALSPSSPS